jgi:hypothetical protein
MALKVKNRIKLSREKKASPARPKPFKAAKGARYVLLVGDEGAILLHMNGNNVLTRQYVPDSGQQHLDELKETLAKDPKAPLMLVVDSMDQTYVQHTLPPVSKLNVGKLIKQRLDRDFGPDVIKGALLLGREEKGRRDWNFLMISVEKSAHFTVWLEFAQAQPNRFLGIYLLAVECETIVKNLERAINRPKTESDSQWKFFVSHNKVGGFRQVMIRNGRMVFTRLAQPLAESKPEVIAGNIEQEILNTIEYMKRLSYNPADGLDVYVLASAGVKAAIDGSKFEARHWQALTPFEVAQYFNIEGATQQTDQFGDVILAASIGASGKHTLKFDTPISQKLDKLFQMFIAQRAAVALVALGIIGYAGYVGTDIYSLGGEIEKLEQSKMSIQQQKEGLDREIAQSKLDVDKVSEMIDFYQVLTKQRISPLPLLKAMEPMSGLPVKIKAINWKIDAPSGTPATAVAAAGSPPAKILASVQLEFSDSGSNVNEVKEKAKKVLEQAKQMLKGYEVAYDKLPPELQEDSRLQIDFKEDPNAKPISKTILVDLIIKGSAVPPTQIAKAAP